MRIRTRMLLAVALAAAVGLGVLATLAFVTQRANSSLRAQQDSQEVARYTSILLTLTQEYTVYRGERTDGQWLAGHASLLATIDSTIARERSPHPDLLAVRMHARNLLPLYEGLKTAYELDATSLAQRRRELMIERLISGSQELVQSRYRWALAIGDQQARDQAWTTAVVLGAPGLLLLLVLGLAWLLGRRVLNPLAQLRAATAAIQQGSLEVRCDTGSNDELADTGKAVNAMADGLLAANRSLEAEVEQRRGAEARLRVVMESSPLGMFVGDARGHFLYTNPAWQRISGLTAAQALGTGARSALHPQDREAVLRVWDELVAGGTARVHEHRYQRPDGAVVWVRRHAAPMRLENGELGVVCTVEDITERRRLDEVLAARTSALHRSNEELERFAYVASHDLQEPLRMVCSYGQLLERRAAKQLDSEAQEFLDYIVDGGRRAQALIADLLRLARVESQAKPMQTVDLAGVLAEVLDVLRVPLQAAGAEVSFEALPTVVGEPQQLSQLLQNLIANALKFRGATPSCIHIGAERDERLHGWKIWVQDNGIGIDPRFHERIFVLFQRLHLRSEYEGTGIGLAICKKVVERHGGQIGVVSQPDAGALFHFSLPDANRVGAPGAALPATADAAALREAQTA